MQRLGEVAVLDRGIIIGVEDEPGHTVPPQEQGIGQTGADKAGGSRDQNAFHGNRSTFFGVREGPETVYGSPHQCN